MLQPNGFDQPLEDGNRDANSIDRAEKLTASLFRFRPNWLSHESLRKLATKKSLVERR